MRRLLLALALALASAVPGLAQSQQTAYFTIRYDVAVEQPTFTYCSMQGQRGNPWDEPIRVNIPIETAGSSTTVTAVTALTAPFTNVAVGDAIFVRLGGGLDQTDMVTVTARASADSITVSSAVDWSAGYVFSYLDLVCGTDTAAGWIDVSNKDTIQMTVEYAAGDMTGLDVVFECKDNGLTSAPVQVYPGPSSECGFGTLNTDVCTLVLNDALTVKLTYNAFKQCRVGLAWRTADGATVDAVNTTLTGIRYLAP
jgi:hypothetical protein